MYEKIRIRMVGFSLALLFASGIISLYWIQKNDQAVMALHKQIQTQDKQISDLWQNTIKLNSDANTYLILKNFPQNMNNPQNFESKLAAIENRQTTMIERINSIYLEKTELENTLASKTQSSRFYVSLAFFLQILSVALVTVTRDMKKA